MSPVEVSATLSQEHFQSEFVSRVAKLPIVNTGLGYTSAAYEKAKTINPLVAWTLETAESTVWGAATRVRPVVDRLGTPLGAADGLACKGLDKVEEIVPGIQKTVDQLYDDAVGVVNHAKAFGYVHGDRLMKSKPGVMALTGLNLSLDYAEKYLDNYLPPQQGETPLSGDASVKTPLDRVAGISIRVQRRSLAAAVGSYHQAQALLKQIADNSVLLEMARHNAEALMKLAKVKLDSFEQIVSNLLAATQQSAKQLKAALFNLQANLQPVITQRYHDILDQTTTAANRLYTVLIKNSRFGPISDELLLQLHKQAVSLSKHLHQLAEVAKVYLVAIVGHINADAAKAIQSRLQQQQNKAIQMESLNKVD